ncbi:hypothetical protein PR048_020156 [Dryococelus australis]|uniref:Uncharacterized protein n=1 Tax=Dryococelus australis TaxID=614101 RepID=A0ABQ9H5W5_9NEOP|nr:hypothetical protein PR048_020156 [Dryococelus australis]
MLRNVRWLQNSHIRRRQVRGECATANSTWFSRGIQEDNNRIQARTGNNVSNLAYRCSVGDLRKSTACHHNPDQHGLVRSPCDSEHLGMCKAT